MKILQRFAGPIVVMAIVVAIVVGLVFSIPTWLKTQSDEFVRVRHPCQEALAEVKTETDSSHQKKSYLTREGKNWYYQGTYNRDDQLPLSLLEKASEQSGIAIYFGPVVWETGTPSCQAQSQSFGLFLESGTEKRFWRAWKSLAGNCQVVNRDRNHAVPLGRPFFVGRESEFPNLPEYVLDRSFVIRDSQGNALIDANFLSQETDVADTGGRVVFRVGRPFPKTVHHDSYVWITRLESDIFCAKVYD